VKRSLISAIAGAVLAASALVAIPGTATAAPLPPQSDPFYQPPSGFQSTSPGTILKARTVSVAAFGYLPQKVQAWQLLYRTTDTQGNPEATVTTVLAPLNALEPSKGASASRPLLSYQVAEDSSAPQCAISYQLQQGSDNSNTVAEAEILLIDAAVQQGWAVSVPDYEGPASAYTGGKQAGQAVLDGIRATENFSSIGLAGAATKVGIWGYSGGALASGWASELQPGYAPELHIAGVAEGGLPVNLRDVLNGINGGPFAGIAMSGIAGLAHAYPQLAGFLTTYLTPAGKSAFATVNSQCNAQNAARFAFTNIYQYFNVSDPLSLPVPQQVLTDDTLGQHTPTAPMFIYQSVNDELIPPADVDAVVNKYCSAGATVAYQRDVLSEHVILAVTGAPDALNFLIDRFNGKPAASGCSTTNVASSLFSPGASQTFGSVIFNDLLALAAQPIGPGDMA
jgi:hypothetical protein